MSVGVQFKVLYVLFYVLCSLYLSDVNGRLDM